MQTSAIHAPGPVHEGADRILWHRGNGGEAIPGVSTPLNADFWRASMEVALLRTFHRLGAMSAAERGGPDGAGSPHLHQLCRFFYGRLSSNFDAVCELYGRLPGVDPNVIEEQILGRVRGLTRPPTTLRRRVVATMKTAWTLASIPRRVRRRSRLTESWWRASIDRATTFGPDDADRALALLDEARERMRTDLALQVTVASLQPGFVDQLRRSAATLDDETALALLGGVGGIAEADMMSALWTVARHDGDLDRFITLYGYYGPDEGELSTRSWRDDPSALDGVIVAYRGMAEAEGPVARMHDRVRAHATARRAALDGRPGLARVRLRVVLRLARRYTELREVGKALMLQCLDVGRAGARALGTALVARGVLERAEDVFFLTTDEARVATADGVDRRALVGDRRDQHERYRSITLPLSFDGSELAAIVDAQLDGDDASTASRAVVEGLGVSQGTATGIARVVLDPLECRDFVPGEILVCSTTDPGWAPVLSLAGGVVLDMGSMLSHGAIVARELGVPCVANTTDGTRRIPDGALVHLDGTSGVVDVIDPAPAPATGDAA